MMGRSRKGPDVMSMIYKSEVYKSIDMEGGIWILKVLEVFLYNCCRDTINFLRGWVT